jgi:L-amino acid N-acyltransferase YncA
MGEIRDARETDVTQVTEIYSHHVRHGLASFEEVPPDAAEILARMRSVRSGGLQLLQALIERCEQGPWKQMIAVIGDSENAASIGLHHALGFRTIGTLEAVGFKFGRWVDSVLMQRALGR